VFSAPPGGKEVTKIWRSPVYTRLAAMEYLRAAAFAAADDPERANYLFIAIDNMCHWGHVSIRQVKGFPTLALGNLDTCRPPFGAEPELMMVEPEKDVQKLINRLDSLVKSGSAQLHLTASSIPSPIQTTRRLLLSLTSFRQSLHPTKKSPSGLHLTDGSSRTTPSSTRSRRRIRRGTP